MQVKRANKKKEVEKALNKFANSAYTYHIIIIFCCVHFHLHDNNTRVHIGKKAFNCTYSQCIKQTINYSHYERKLSLDRHQNIAKKQSKKKNERKKKYKQMHTIIRFFFLSFFYQSYLFNFFMQRDRKKNEHFFVIFFFFIQK